jgi:hypothetical protein
MADICSQRRQIPLWFVVVPFRFTAEFRYQQQNTIDTARVEYDGAVRMRGGVRHAVERGHDVRRVRRQGPYFVDGCVVRASVVEPTTTIRRFFRSL